MYVPLYTMVTILTCSPIYPAISVSIPVGPPQTAEGLDRVLFLLTVSEETLNLNPLSISVSINYTVLLHAAGLLCVAFDKYETRAIHVRTEVYKYGKRFRKVTH